MVCVKCVKTLMWFLLFDDGNSKLNLQTIKGTLMLCVWSGGMKRNSKL